MVTVGAGNGPTCDKPIRFSPDKSKTLSDTDYRTVVGGNYVSDEVRRTLGPYPQLGKQAARDIPGCKLVELQRVGHIPHLEAPAAFIKWWLSL